MGETQQIFILNLSLSLQIAMPDYWTSTVYSYKTLMFQRWHSFAKPVFPYRWSNRRSTSLAECQDNLETMMQQTYVVVVFNQSPHNEGAHTDTRVTVSVGRRCGFCVPVTLDPCVTARELLQASVMSLTLRQTTFNVKWLFNVLV